MELNKELGQGIGGIRAPLIGLSHISTVYEALSDSCKSDMHLLKCFSFSFLLRTSFNWQLCQHCTHHDSSLVYLKRQLALCRTPKGRLKTKNRNVGGGRRKWENYRRGTTKSVGEDHKIFGTFYCWITKIWASPPGVNFTLPIQKTNIPSRCV